MKLVKPKEGTTMETIDLGGALLADWTVQQAGNPCRNHPKSGEGQGTQRSRRKPSSAPPKWSESDSFWRAQAAFILWGFF